MLTNREISRMFNLYSELLLLHDRNEKLAGLLSGAAYRIRRINEDLIGLSSKQLSVHFKPELVRLFSQLQSHGNLEDLDELIQLTPSGLFDMMRIRGLGGKKLHTLWKKAKIDNIEALLQACKKHELSKIPGFGAKTEQNISDAIESFNRNQYRFHYASVAEIADRLVHQLQKVFRTSMVCLAGEIRRQCTTVAAIEIIATIKIKDLKVAALKKLLIIQSSADNKTIAHTHDEIPVIIYHTSPANFFSELFLLTGADAHVKKVMPSLKKSYPSEEAIYKEASLPFIVPELREDVAEWNFDNLKQLIAVDDIKGVVHNHTTWSDGVDTLSDFVKACRKKGYEYVAISDHSKNAHYAGGMKEEKILRQFKEIDELNKKLAPFRIFKSIECDILVSGELDYDNDFLRNFDMVIVSVHQLLRMDQAKATKRLIRAIENPFTTILGHMTGRQLLIRDGYPVDFKKVIDACAANHVVIEINANPYRLDMDWGHIPYAMKKNVMISINPDAHSIGEIDNIRWGVSAARKGGLTKEMTWNTMTAKDIEKWCRNKVRKAVPTVGK